MEEKKKSNILSKIFLILGPILLVVGVILLIIAEGTFGPGNSTMIFFILASLSIFVGFGFTVIGLITRTFSKTNSSNTLSKMVKNLGSSLKTLEDSFKDGYGSTKDRPSKCPSCGAGLKDEDNYCPYCGRKIE